MITTEQREEILETEGARRATGVSRISEAAAGQGPSPAAKTVEVNDKPLRRRMTAEYKLQILKEADACKESRDLGALLRREGLYHSSLSLWRKQQKEGILVALGKKQGRKGPDVNNLVLENKKLRKENDQLKRQLSHAELIIDVQKKISQMLEIPRKEDPEEENG